MEGEKKNIKEKINEAKPNWEKERYIIGKELRGKNNKRNKRGKEEQSSPFGGKGELPNRDGHIFHPASGDRLRLQKKKCNLSFHSL